MSELQKVQEILNRAYGGMGTGPVDRVAATEVINYLRANGWFSGSEVATLVRSAGGTINVSDRDLQEMGDYDLVVTHLNSVDDIAFRLQARRKNAS